MAYITTAERIGMEKGYGVGLQKGIEQGIEKGIKKGKEQGVIQGIEQGIQKGLELERALVLRQLERKFKTIASVYLLKIQEASHQSLLTWAERILDANTVEEVFLN